MDPGFFVRGVQAPQLILQFTEGVQWYYYTFSRGPTFSRGGGGPNVQMLISIETHITLTCDFLGGEGGLDLLSPSGSAHRQSGILARIGSDVPLRLSIKLRNPKC